MATTLAYTESPCRQCGMGKSIDQEKTARNAKAFIGVLEKKTVADKMEISPQYLGDLMSVPPRRPWNSELAEKFESAVTGLKK